MSITNGIQTWNHEDQNLDLPNICRPGDHTTVSLNQKQIHENESSEIPEKVVRDDEIQWKTLEMSETAAKTINTILNAVDLNKTKTNPNKAPIQLDIGDPTKSAALNCHPKATEAILAAIRSGKFNGYCPTDGLPESRLALAKYLTKPEAPVTPDDIILTSGCSQALEIAFQVLANRGDNILIPRPGFSIYSTQMNPMGIEPRYYNLLPNQEWEIDLVDLKLKIDARTKAILVNNPSNPCGSVYSKEHLRKVLRIAAKHKLTIITDEIYGNTVFDGAIFHPMASLKPKVPTLTVDGISKRWLVPGWRLGWLIVNDPYHVLGKIRVVLRQLTQNRVGPCALIQGALPQLLDDIPDSFFEQTRTLLSKNAQICMTVLGLAPGINPIRPYGAMYIMIQIDMLKFPEFKTDLEFANGLIREESVFTLPGNALAYENALRLATTHPEHITKEACIRIVQFCVNHYSN